MRSYLRSSLLMGSLNDKDRKAHLMRAKRILQLPLPHTFHGNIWGPVGARALYSIYLHRDAAYNPFSERGFWLLRNGGFWEVTF